MIQNELTHYGVLGMKWGVRRAQKKEYGMSKRQLNKAIKKSDGENVRKLTKEYSSELSNNAQLRKLGEQSTKVAKALMKSEEEDFRRNPDGKPSSKTHKLYEQHHELDQKMRKIETEIGKKYVDRFNDARLKDIDYSRTVDKGREMLKTYNKNYTVWNDGTIRSNTGFGRGNFIYSDYDAEYIRPHNMN